MASPSSLFSAAASLPSSDGLAPDVAAPIAHTATAIARLDQALGNHPLRHAFLCRTRLETVRRLAAVDGHFIDPWHLAAVLEGAKLRVVGHTHRIAGRGAIFEAARYALVQYQWLVHPDFGQEEAVRRAEAALAAQLPQSPTLLAAAYGMHAWIDSNAEQAPMRAAIVRFWTRRHLLHVPVPLIGVAALQTDISWAICDWIPAFLRAVAGEAADGLDLLLTLERAWRAARGSVAARRRDSHAAAVVDLLAATPVLSATSLASGLGIAIKNAIRLLNELCAEGIAIEVTHRLRRRLFGLNGLAPLHEAAVPPRSTIPEWRNGRRRLEFVGATEANRPSQLLPFLSTDKRSSLDYSDFEQAITQLDARIGNTRQLLEMMMERADPER